MSISPNRSIADVSPNSALLWAEFRTQFDVNGVRKCENLATAPGAPKLLTMGDGYTASTIPAQLVGRHGVALTGTQYIDTGIVDPFLQTQPFTLVICVYARQTNGTSALLATTDQAQSFKGINLVFYQYGITMSMLNTVGGNYIQKNFTDVYGVGPIHKLIICCYSGSSTAADISISINSTSLTGTSVSDTLTGTIKNSKPLLLGARYNGTAKTGFLTGEIRFAAIFPWELSANQGQYLDRLCKTRINAA